MATATFPLSQGPTWGGSLKPEPRVLKTDFGDGYGQRIGDGLNVIRDKRSLRWENLSPADGELADTFLRQRFGSEAFYWTHPRKTYAQKWTCEEWELVDDDPLAITLIATFMEVFDP